MTPSERERRIEAAGDAYAEATFAKHGVGEADLDAIVAALDAADEAVPVVPVASLPIQERNARLLGLGAEYEGHALDSAKLTLYYATGLTVLERAERAEAAARDLYAALAAVLKRFDGWNFTYKHPIPDGREALARHPSFSGEEGTEG